MPETRKTFLEINSRGLWQERMSVIQLITLEDVDERIGYFYLNPAGANLVQTIQKHPCLNSGDFFKFNHMPVAL